MIKPASLVFILIALILAASCTPSQPASPTSGPGQLTQDDVATLLAAPLPQGTLAVPALPPVAPGLASATASVPLLNPAPASSTPPSETPTSAQLTATTSPALPTQVTQIASPASGTPAAAPAGGLPVFSHVFILIFENKEFATVVGSPQMPVFNRLVGANTLLTDYYAVRHPSLPNYLALIGGDTFGVTSDCESCYVDAPSLPDLIEASGRSWRTYQEDIPSACFLGSQGQYAQKHNPFVYFDSIRTDPQRCQAGVVPLTQLQADLASGQAPNFVFISPNLCNSGHDCGLGSVDVWIDSMVGQIQASSAYDASSLIVLTWDEGQGEHTCCGLPAGGGRVATVLISPLARPGFQDDTPYSHYSLLATIAQSWSLARPGHAADELTSLILAPWTQP